MKRFAPLFGVAFALLAFAATSAFAAAIPLFSFDENGHGTGPGGPIPGVIAIDPLTGAAALCYPLPFAPASGDVLLVEQQGSLVSDMFRFFQNNLYVYSLQDDASPPDLADVPILPNLQPNVAGPFPEDGPEGNNGFVWTPPVGTGAPGDIGTSVQYHFISDVPEPAAMMLGFGGVAILLTRRQPRAR